MGTQEVLGIVRRLAEEVGVEWRDLDDLLPEQQIAHVRSRVSLRLLAMREEMHGITVKRQQANRQAA